MPFCAFFFLEMKRQNKHTCCVGGKLQTYGVRGCKTWLAPREMSGKEPWALNQTGQDAGALQTLAMEKLRHTQKKRLLSLTIMLPITQFQQWLTHGFLILPPLLPPSPANWIYTEVNPRYHFSLQNFDILYLFNIRTPLKNVTTILLSHLKRLFLNIIKYWSAFKIFLEHFNSWTRTQIRDIYVGSFSSPFFSTFCVLPITHL